MTGNRHAILATAGHIDHGKSALVKTLTGNDPDRLPEEKKRGITIELGFAQLDLPGHSLGIVDVPGHEDFVKNMVAGVGAVDLALLVVAADDGWMPQTEEHFQILSYLGAERGVIALTKSDLVADTTERELELRAQLANTPLADAAIIPCSAHTGAGMDELRAALTTAADAMPPHTDDGRARLAVDRVFTLQGIGTVATGTLTGGIFKKGQNVTATPPGGKARIRSLHSHNREQDTAQPGTRTALNLAEASRDTLIRGATITLPEFAVTTETIDVYLERSPRLPAECTPLRNDTRVRVHHGSGHWPARLVLMEGKTLDPGMAALAQLRLEQPVCFWPGDRIVIRNWPETATLAGGRVLEARGNRKNLRTIAHKAFLQTRADAQTDARAWTGSLLARDGLAKRDGLLQPSQFSAAEIAEATDALAANSTALAMGDWLADPKRWGQVRDAAAAKVDAVHASHPEVPGLALENLRAGVEKAFAGHDVFPAFLADFCAQGFVRKQSHVARTSHKPALPSHLRDVGERIRQALAAPDPPAKKNFTESPTGRAALQFLIETGEATDLGTELVLGTAQFNRLRLIVKKHLRQHGQATASELRKAMETNRRILIPVLEKLDRDGVTARRGDVRILRKTD